MVIQESYPINCILVEGSRSLSPELGVAAPQKPTAEPAASKTPSDLPTPGRLEDGGIVQLGWTMNADPESILSLDTEAETRGRFRGAACQSGVEGGLCLCGVTARRSRSVTRLASGLPPSSIPSGGAWNSYGGWPTPLKWRATTKKIQPCQRMRVLEVGKQQVTNTG